MLKALLDRVPARPEADGVRKLTKVTKPIRLNVESFSGEKERVEVLSF